MRGAACLAMALLAALPAQAASPPAGASSCSGCHPPRPSTATPVPPLAGRAPAEIVAALRAFRSGARPSTVMGRIAEGFTDAEAAAIAAWYSGEPR
jgi:cytochrome c553